MRVVTSFSPSRTSRQLVCLESWRNAGCSVVAVQSPGEIEALSKTYSNVEFIETDLVGDVFGRPECVRLSSMLRVASESPVLIVNSDICFLQTPDRLSREWGESEEKQLKIGVRWDVYPNGRRKLFKWGIDVFRITPEIASIVPDLGMTIGCPVWDYWLPWYLVQQGFTVKTNLSSGFNHNIHKQNWSKEEYAAGFEIVKKHHGISDCFLTDFIQKLTNRNSLRG